MNDFIYFDMVAEPSQGYRMGHRSMDYDFVVYYELNIFIFNDV